MIPAFQKDEALLADVGSTVNPLDPGFRLWWLGQSGYLIQWQGRHVLLDPYLSDSLTVKYATTDKPHVRMTELVIDPAKLGFVSVVTSTHNHTDHLDAETLLPLMAANPSLQMVIPEANRAFVAARLKTPQDWPIGLNDGQLATVDGFTFHAVPAAHENLDRDGKGQCLYLGYVVKFGPWTIYHSGDTVLYPGMEELLRPFRVDVALLPINGRGPERRVSGNLWGREAARLAKDMAARVAIPCHYDMFEFNTASPAEFIANCQSIGQGFRVLNAGESFNSRELP